MFILLGGLTEHSRKRPVSPITLCGHWFLFSSYKSALGKRNIQNMYSINRTWFSLIKFFWLPYLALDTDSWYFNIPFHQNLLLETLKSRVHRPSGGPFFSFFDHPHLGVFFLPLEIEFCQVPRGYFWPHIAHTVFIDIFLVLSRW